MRVAGTPEQRAERKRERDIERKRVLRSDPVWAEQERKRRRERYATDPEFAERQRERKRKMRSDPENAERENERKRERYAVLVSTMEGRGLVLEKSWRQTRRRRALRIAAHDEGFIPFEAAAS